MQNKIYHLSACILCALIAFTSCDRKKNKVEEPLIEEEIVYPLGFCTDSLHLERGIIRSGEVFTGLMTRLGMRAKDAYALALAADTIFDMKKLRAGNGYEAYFHLDTNGLRSLKYLVYDADKVNRTVFKCEQPFEIWQASKPVERKRSFVDVSISSSLWNDMIAAEASPSLIVELSEIYAWTIDFFALQEGDRFQVIYEQDICEGETVGSPSVFYAVFNHSGKEYPAIMLEADEGGNKYWNQNGESLKKAFLKAPLKFSRVSSGFSYRRKHPVTGVVKPHTGVDYAAPKGTPVMSIGDGKVLSKGWAGGGGNTVKIRHNSVYTTAYLHLSKYAAGLKVGQYVSQGEVIGYVGATGTATGPHLDFRVWKNGTPINPLTMEAPACEPLPIEMKPVLDSVYTLYRAEMDSLMRLKADLNKTSQF